MSQIKQIKGNLHQIKLSELQLACDSNMDWWNPRRTPLPDGTVCEKGLGDQDISELAESIKNQGLNDPISVRGFEDGTLQVIAGDRRFNAINSLIEANEECFDPYTSEWKPAEEVYEYVEARLHNDITDEKAWQIAFQENSTSVDIGDNATIALIKKWRDLGWDDSAILKMTGKSITWLRETDHIIQLDDDTFSAFASGELNRSAAVDLSKIEDVADRISRLEKAKVYAQKHLDALRQAAKDDLEKAERSAEIAEACVVEAEIAGEDVEQAEKEAEDAAQSADVKRQKSDHLESKNAEVGIKDVRNAAREEGDDVFVSLTMAKLKKHHFKPCAEIHETGGFLDDEEVEGINMEDVMLINSLAEAIELGNRDIVGILQEHYANVCEEVEEEEEEEVSEDADDDEEEVVGESEEEYEEEYEDYDYDLDAEAEAAAQEDAEADDWE